MALHVCDRSRRIFHPHNSVPRHEADALRNDRRAVLSALPIHTAAINSAFKHQTTPHQTTVVNELHYKAEHKVLVRSLHEFGTSMLLTVAFWIMTPRIMVSRYPCCEGGKKNFFSLQGKYDGQITFFRHDTNRLSKRMMPPAQTSK